MEEEYERSTSANAWGDGQIEDRQGNMRDRERMEDGGGWREEGGGRREELGGGGVEMGARQQAGAVFTSFLQPCKTRAHIARSPLHLRSDGRRSALTPV